MSSKSKTIAAKEEAKPALVPKLRFPGFSAPWTFEPIAKVLKEHKLKNTAGRDVFSVSMEFGVVNQIELLGRSFAAADTSHYTVGRQYDVVYTKSPLKAFPFGIVKQCKFDGEIALSPLYGVFTPANPYLGLMIEAYFESPSRSFEFLSPLCQKGAKNTLQITNATFLSGRLPIPAQPVEQRKIAECLSSVDELVAAHARKVDALKTYKKGLMQQLFPLDGESQPRFRLPEFRASSDWVKAKLGNQVDIQSGYSPSNYALSSSGKYPFVKVEDLNNCAKYQFSAREYCDAQVGLVLKGSIVFPKRGAAIELNKIRIAAEDILVDTILMALTPRNGLAVVFLYYYLSNVGLAHIADTSTIPQINNKHIIPFDLCLPEEAEQQRIALCLSSVDELIAAETQKLETLKTHKKGLMQQLFPYPGAVEA